MFAYSAGMILPLKTRRNLCGCREGLEKFWVGALSLEHQELDNRSAATASGGSARCSYRQA